MARRFNPAPGWPAAPEGWLPPVGWEPDPLWPPAPYGWALITDAPSQDVDARRSGNVGLSREQLEAQRQRRQAKQDLAAARRLRKAETRDERAADPTHGLKAGFGDYSGLTLVGTDARRDAERQNRLLVLTKQLLDEQKETNRLLAEMLEELRRRA